MPDHDDYTPAIITAGEDREVELAFYDDRIGETEYVTMPDPDE